MGRRKIMYWYSLSSSIRLIGLVDMKSGYGFQWIDRRRNQSVGLTSIFSSVGKTQTNQWKRPFYFIVWKGIFRLIKSSFGLKHVRRKTGRVIHQRPTLHNILKKNSVKFRLLNKSLKSFKWSKARFLNIMPKVHRFHFCLTCLIHGASNSKLAVVIENTNIVRTPQRIHFHCQIKCSPTGVNVTGPPNETLKTEFPCHSRCDTMKNPYW